MKTAVDWLVDHLYLVIPNEERDFLEGLREEALKKEKEQIVEAYDRGYKACDLDEALEINKTMFSGEKYYEQTYNQKQHIIDIMKADEDDGLYKMFDTNSDKKH